MTFFKNLFGKKQTEKEFTLEQKAEVIYEWIFSGESGPQIAAKYQITLQDLNGWETEVMQAGPSLEELAGKARKDRASVGHGPQLEAKPLGANRGPRQNDSRLLFVGSAK